MVCHGCYDAPCQLKLSSPAGIERGGNKNKVYNGSRFITATPTRLGIDAKTTEEWREKDFHPVLNEGDNVPVANLSQSLIYRMLRMKQVNPQAVEGMLPDEIDISLDRKQSCPTLEEFDVYQFQHPLQGMPFAMPNLNDKEYKTLVQWLAQGSPLPVDKKPSAIAVKLERGQNTDNAYIRRNCVLIIL